MVGWLSGRKRLLGEQVCSQEHPGFESLPHRHRGLRAGETALFPFIYAHFYGLKRSPSSGTAFSPSSIISKDSGGSIRSFLLIIFIFEPKVRFFSLFS